MTERTNQKSVVHLPTQEEIAQLAEESVLARPISRRTFLIKKASIFVAGVGLVASLGGVFGSCSNTEKPTTSITETTGSSTTTTSIEAPTTSTTEAQGPFEKLVKPDETAADLANKPKIPMSEPVPVECPDQLQAEYMAINPGFIIYWVGEHNIATDLNSFNGNQFNDILVGLQAIGIDSKVGAWGGFDGFGGNSGIAELDPVTGEKKLTIGSVVMEITNQPIILTADGFYLEGQNPRTGDLYYVRIVMGGEYGDPTILNCHDVSTGDYVDYAVPPIGAQGDNTQLYKDRENHYASKLSKEALAEFFAPGRVIYVLAKGDGKSDFFPKRWLTDENNILVARLAIILGNGPSADEIDALFR